MEEYVGGLWHRWITRAAERIYPEAVVRLADMERSAGILFRAFGGDAGLKVAHAADVEHTARRSLLQRIAGSGKKTAHAAVDGEVLRLPSELALFPDRLLNRDLYLWLIALAARSQQQALGETAACRHSGPAECDDGPQDEETAWLRANQAASLATLARFPGFTARYQRLAQACITARLKTGKDEEAAREAALCQAILHPGSVARLPAVAVKPGSKTRDLQAVPLWLYPSPTEWQAASAGQADTATQHESEANRGRETAAGRKRYKAERAEMPKDKNGMLLMFRAESLFSWGEYVKVNRHTEEDENPDAAAAAEDMDRLALARDDSPVASRVRFDLDLPSAALDDQPLGEGIALPEWDWKKRRMQPDWCRLQVLTARDAPPTAIPERLARSARRLRSQFSALTPVRRWLRNQADGAELDVDACIRAAADRAAGIMTPEGGYLAQSRCERDLACLVLADLSLSTDAHVSDSQRVIDVIRDSLLLFGEALKATGDRFGLYGFSSLKRGHVRFHQIKTFDARFDDAARGRILALKPGYYTRMGAAIRQSTALLSQQPSRQRVLLLLSDGKPNDLDQYEGRYGIEDTRMAVLEARKAGVLPFCVTIDREGQDYLNHIFGPAGYMVIRDPAQLPARLPQFYAQVTAGG